MAHPNTLNHLRGMQSEPKNYCDIFIIEELVRNKHFVIYKAQSGSKFIALKSPIVQDAMMTEMLRREYEIGKSLAHPLIVNTLDFLPSSPVGPAIVIEYIKGDTLDKFIAQNPPLATRHRIVQDLLEGVRYLHRQSIFHNDLKASNIMVNSSGSARIIDFGLSISDDSAYRGCFGGTSGSSAPEILNGEGVGSAATDIYSLGKLINLVYGGRHLKKVVERCLREDTSQRYQTILDLQHAILWHRYKWAIISATVALITLVALVVAPYIATSLQQINSARSLRHIEQRMERLYRPALEAVTEQQYSEFAHLHKGKYCKGYIEYHASLPDKEKRLCEELFVKQLATLDSVATSKPSFMALPDQKQRTALIEEFNSYTVE